MKGLLVAFFLFTAFAIVLAHGIIPHHHPKPDHAHKHEHSHHSHDHTHHPAQENHADHHNMYTWFIYGKKDLTLPPTQLSDNAVSANVNNCQLCLPDAVVNKINLPPELNSDISNTDHCNNKLLRAPPFFLA